MNELGMWGCFAAIGMSSFTGCHSGVNRRDAGVFRTPHEKAKKVKAAKRNKAARKARKRNRR